MKKVGVILLLAMVTAVLAWGARGFRTGELAEKPVYAALQAVELAHRGVVGETTLLVRENDLAFAGFPVSSNGRVWIVLNRSRGDGRVFSLPEDGEKQVTCHRVAALPAETHAQVRETLKAYCNGG